MEANNDIWKRRKPKEKNLVTDQPGNFILFIGVFISLVLGFSLRSFTQSKFLNELAQEATRNIGPDWKLNFEEVRIYLDDGFLPALGLEIKNLKMTSESECFLKPLVEMNSVRIPVSLVDLVFNQNPFSEVLIDKAHVDFAISQPNCDKKNVESKKVSNSQVKQNRIVLVDKNTSSIEKSQQHNVKTVFIKKIEINFLDGAYPKMVFGGLLVENKSEKPKIMVLKTQIDISNLFKSQVGDIAADLTAEYNEFPEKILKVNLLGSVREGHFSVSLLNRIEEKKYQLQADIKNLPVLKLLDLSIIKIKEDSPVRSGWISFSAYSEGESDKFELSRVEFKRIRVEGEFGDIISDEVIFPLGIKTPPEAFSVSLNNFKMDSFVEGNRLFKIPDQINSFGTINGKLNYFRYDKIAYEGKLTDLAFNFSSGGLRQVEKINSIVFNGELTKDEFKFKSSEIYHKNKLEGFIDFILRKDKSFQLKVDVKQVQLSDKVSKLLTQKNEAIMIDSFKMKAIGNKEEAKFSSRVEVSRLANLYLGIQNATVEIESTLNKEISINLKATKLDVDEKLKSLFAKNSIPALDSYNQVILNYKSDYKKSHWNLTSNSKWNSQGAWDNKGLISGTLKAPKQEWIIQGTRDEPQIYKKSH